jgi:threonine/homoserine/homoserine lactone efflux protein
MTIDPILALIIALVLYIFKPGPGMATYITRTVQQGFASGYAIVLGVLSIEILFFSAAAFSLSLLDPKIIQTSALLKSLAASYMLFLGVRGIIQYKNGIKIVYGGKKTLLSLLESFALGITITLSNPYTFMFYATVVPSILDLDNSGNPPIIAGFAVIAGVGLLVRTCIVVMAHQFREYLADTAFLKYVNLLTSAVFILIGLFLAWSLLPVFIPTLYQ